MGFFSKEEVPPPPDMSGVVRASADIAKESVAHANEVFSWAKDAVAKNSTDISGFVDKITSDSDTARGMIQDFQNVADKALGIQSGALDIRDAALKNAAAAGDVQSKQMAIQESQLGEQDKQLANQQRQLGVQDQFLGDQKAQQGKADQLFNQYSQTYDPAMARFMADAEAYGSPERAAQARAGAAATVGEQFQGAREAAERQLQGYGMQTRMGALDLGTRIKEAATKAAAAQKAQQDTEAAAFALRNQAIAQGKDLTGQATAATNAATGIGGLANTAAANANAAGNVAANFGSLANSAGANAIGAGNLQTGAINAATGATNTAIGAGDSATRANTGALAANTAAATGEAAAGNLTNQTLGAESQALGTAPQYLGAANQATATQGNTMSQAYKNQMDQFKAEQSNTSGLGQLLGTAAGIGTKALLTGGTSLPFDIAGQALGGTASNLSGDTLNFGAGASFAEGGAIPMSSSPSQGQATDDVKAMVNAGEFIMPRDVTSWYGEKFFQQLIQKAQAEKSKAQAKPAVGPMPAGPPTVASAPGPAIPMGA